MNQVKILDSLCVPDRGFAFVGKVLAGTVAVGMAFSVTEAGHTWRLTAKSVSETKRANGAVVVTVLVDGDRWLPGLGVGQVVDFHAKAQ